MTFLTLYTFPHILCHENENISWNEELVLTFFLPGIELLLCKSKCFLIRGDILPKYFQLDKI